MILICFLLLRRFSASAMLTNKKVPPIEQITAAILVKCDPFLSLLSFEISLEDVFFLSIIWLSPAQSEKHSCKYDRNLNTIISRNLPEVNFASDGLKENNVTLGGKVM